MTRGERIRARLQALNMSQAELARRVGMKQPSIHALITSNKTGSRKIAEIARVLETTPEYLNCETDVASPAGAVADDRHDYRAAPPEDRLTPAEREWVENFRRLDDPNRRALEQLVRTAAGAGKRGK